MSVQWVRPKLRERLLAGAPPRWVLKHLRSAYVMQAVLATPPWVDRRALKELADHRDALTQKTGIRHQLDHIIPLSHPRVCGLNVPWNLCVLPASANARKTNAWCEWHGDLFTDPEQFSLFI